MSLKQKKTIGEIFLNIKFKISIMHKSELTLLIATRIEGLRRLNVSVVTLYIVFSKKATLKNSE